MVEGDTQLEVRVLGGLSVVRADGSVVDPGAWSTGKAMDLMRILALENGHGVPVGALAERLWPDVDRARGRASLSTARRRIRAAVGHDCVVRAHDRLVLTGATVDVDTFRRLACATRHASARDAWGETQRLARAAEAVYRGDFHARDDDSGWAVHARGQLQRLRLVLLTDAARCASRARQHADALELSRTAALLDPASGAPHRALMLAHAGLDEVGQALRVFEAHRLWLARELGTEPSRSTRELHARLLQDCAI